MIPAPFEYAAAGSSGEALDLLARYGEDAKLLAGGHSLVPMMKLRLAAPSALVDIGAVTTHAEVAASRLVRSRAPLLAHAAARIGDPQIRHRGTIGGSLAHA